MNSLIEKLALESGFKQYEGSSIYSPYIEGCELNDELEEFAKLIIEECKKAIDPTDDLCSIAEEVHRYGSIELINRHFGIK